MEQSETNVGQSQTHVGHHFANGNLRICGFGKFDSTNLNVVAQILKCHGGIVGFPESLSHRILIQRILVWRLTVPLEGTKGIPRNGGRK